MLFVAFAGAHASAQMTPVGTWRSIDDDTKQPKAQWTRRSFADALQSAVEAINRSKEIQHA